jgi:tRNA/tmRNA/rRNA uracil-C5-methylase (TrmA/RlmC/RlmD family)
VVLDPPRSGAGEKVVTLIAERQPRTVVYVACDPVALGRDLAIFRAHGYRLSALTALDAFPMTHHFETVATLTAEIDGHPII